MNSNSYLVVDFDSTFVKLETLDEIAKEVLRENPRKEEIQKEVEEITKKGMRGEISFVKSLRDRLSLFSVNRKVIEKVSQKIKENVSKSFLENKDFFKKNGQQIFIVSGGFRECIFLVSDEFKIPRENVLANEFVFDDEDKVIGVDENNLLSKTQGKVKQVEVLNLKEKIFVIGDGWTDYEIKREEMADYFLVFVENVTRSNVINLADKVVKNFGEVIQFIEKKSF